MYFIFSFYSLIDFINLINVDVDVECHLYEERSRGKSYPNSPQTAYYKRASRAAFLNRPTWRMSHTRSRTVVAHYLVLHHPVFWQKRP